MRSRGVNDNNIFQIGDVMPIDIRERFFFFNPDDPNDPRNNIDARYPRLLQGRTGNYISSSHYLYNASFFRLKFLQLGYTIPRAVTSRMQMERMRLFVSGENLLTITSFPGLDPETGSGVNPYPISRILTGGINITF